ncbi:MAG: ABC transporter permease subunit, partial [Lentisphaerae bacterium]|nr:ABC transporter permease subunit [Lentisphaerota bacterium]
EFWRTTGWIMLFIVPIISMGSLAGEKSKGTMELLLTSPLTFSNLVWGKFSALFLFYLVLLAPTTVYFGFMRWHGDLGLAQIASGYVGAILLGAATLAIGIFISALTGNQIVAAFGTFATILCFWFIDAAGSTMPSFWRTFIRHLSIYVHYKTIVTGRVGLDDVVYLLSVAGFFLFMTHVSIRALWKTGKWD